MSIRDDVRLLQAELGAASRDAGGTFTPWSQYTVVNTRRYATWLGVGVCQGLSIKFLECCKRGGDFLREVAAIGTFPEEEDETTSFHHEIFDAHVAGNSSLQVGSSLENQVEFMWKKYRMVYVQQKTFGNSFEMSPWEHAAEFCRFEPFYYLLATPGHAMAVAMSPGDYRFFDPNCGIARMRESHLRTLFSAYFGSWAVRWHYGGWFNMKLLVRCYG